MNMRYSFVSWLLPNRWLFVANGTTVKLLKYECSRVIHFESQPSGICSYLYHHGVGVWHNLVVFAVAFEPQWLFALNAVKFWHETGY